MGVTLFDDASIVLIPSGIKASKVYSVKPDDGTGDLTFSRASTATRTNSAGLIESVASDVPRLDYSGGATCPSLLLEPQRTNLVSYSEEFDNAFWTKGNFSTISANATTSPDGTLSADKHVSANSTAAFALGWTSASVVAGTAYTFSVYLKRSEVRFVQLRNNVNGNLLCNFDLELGVAGTPSAGLTASISDAGSGWYRCVITATAGASGTVVFVINMANSITDGLAPTYIGNGVNGYFVWGAQLEVGSFVSSYIPTTTAAVTRLADLASKTGISSLIGQTEGTVFFGFNLTRHNDAKNLGSIDVGDITNFITITINAGIPRLTVRQSGSSTILFSSTQLAFGNHKLAVGYKSGDYVMYINGTQVGTSSSTIYPVGTLTRYVLSNSSYGDLADSYNQAALFPTRLTNAQLASLTSL
jgi:hypothetical protein